LLVQARQDDGTYADVTQEWLALGFARGLATPDSEHGVANNVHTNAILLLQVQADRNGDGDLSDSGETGTYYGATGRYKFYPINMYDTREGELRDVSGSTTCAIGGVMNLVDLDVRNLRRWLTGAIGTTGTDVENVTQNGYILYFSDRRGMRPGPGGVLTGEYGYEDTINPPASAGTPDGLMHASEDVNDNGQLDVFGRANLGDGFIAAAQGGDFNTSGRDRADTRINCNTGAGAARKNRVSGARHAMRLVNGSLGNLPTRPDGSGGFTVASENLVYVLGNYNANDAGYGNPHAAAAIISDAASFLSKNWKDRNSFLYPTTMGSSQRNAVSTRYRVAVAAGKPIAFPHPSWAGTGGYGFLYGLDGGPHNFLRYLEYWTASQTFSYRGSLVSLYYSEYGTGFYKCCNAVYDPPTRDFTFDSDFLDPTRLPPGTPRFRDIVNLGFRQLFNPE
jgi:hypothetical protein